MKSLDRMRRSQGKDICAQSNAYDLNWNTDIELRSGLQRSYRILTSDSLGFNYALRHQLLVDRSNRSVVLYSDILIFSESSFNDPPRERGAEDARVRAQVHGDRPRSHCPAQAVSIAAWRVWAQSKEYE